MNSRDELESLWSTTEPLTGWDFGRLRVRRAPVPWDYSAVVTSILSQEDDVLDIGTGGGEKLIRLASSFRSALGIDPDPSMIETAVANAAKGDLNNLSFRVATAADTGQKTSSVGGVINRHSVLNVDEIYRVTKPGGYVVSQQVGERNLVNLLEPFGGQPFDTDQHPQRIRSELEGRGFSILRIDEYDVEYRFLDLESVLFQIKAIESYLAEMPTIDSLERMVEAIADGDGEYVSNEHRVLIVARKGSG